MEESLYFKKNFLNTGSLGRLLITSYCGVDCILSRETVIALMMEERRMYQPDCWYQK